VDGGPGIPYVSGFTLTGDYFPGVVFDDGVDTALVALFVEVTYDDGFTAGQRGLIYPGVPIEHEMGFGYPRAATSAPPDWDSNTDYTPGQVTNSTSGGFRTCILGGNTGVEPGVTPGWATYWDAALPDITWSDAIHWKFKVFSNGRAKWWSATDLEPGLKNAGGFNGSFPSLMNVGVGMSTIGSPPNVTWAATHSVTNLRLCYIVPGTPGTYGDWSTGHAYGVNALFVTVDGDPAMPTDWPTSFEYFGPAGMLIYSQIDPPTGTVRFHPDAALDPPRPTMEICTARFTDIPLSIPGALETHATFDLNVLAEITGHGGELIEFNFTANPDNVDIGLLNDAYTHDFFTSNFGTTLIKIPDNGTWFLYAYPQTPGLDVGLTARFVHS
jgi:hypothetical protein